MPNRPISGAQQRTWKRLRSAPRATIATATMASLGLAGLGYAATQPTKARTATVTTMTATSTTTNWTGLADQVPTPDLHWTTCQKIAQCATAELPVNYHDPHDAKIKVGLLKIKAKDPAHRIGTLFVNPGGPGQAAEPTALQFAEDASSNTQARFTALAAQLKAHPLRLAAPGIKAITFGYASLIFDIGQWLRQDNGYQGLFPELTDVARLSPLSAGRAPLRAAPHARPTVRRCSFPDANQAHHPERVRAPSPAEAWLH